VTRRLTSAVSVQFPRFWRIQLRPGRGAGEPQLVNSLLTRAEDQEIEAANASGNPPVVFMHGLWVLPSSWDRWGQFFRGWLRAAHPGLAGRS
jgi:hypothetical protein